MGYFEIILMGYVFNLAAFAASIIISVILTLLGTFVKGVVVSLDETKTFNEINNEFKEKSIGIPFFEYTDFKDYGKFFPFGSIFKLLHFVVFATMYGPVIYISLKIQKKIDRIDYYKDQLKLQEE